MARARLPGDGLGAWATANAITFDGVEIQDRGSDSPTARGYGIFAQRDLVEEATGPLITVPHHLILSKATVREQAEHDARLKELLDAAGELAEVGSSGCFSVPLSPANRYARPLGESLCYIWFGSYLRRSLAWPSESKCPVPGSSIAFHRSYRDMTMEPC